MVDITFLGTGGTMPMPDRHLSSVLMNIGGKKVLLDCGEGTQIAIRSMELGFKAIDVICISHFHGDHTAGIPGLLATIANSGREEPLTIIGPKGIDDVVNGLRVIVPYLPYKVNTVEASQNEIELWENLKVISLELDHTSQCVGYRFTFKRNPKFSVEEAEKNNIPKNYWSKLQKGNTIRVENKIFTPDMVLGEARQGIDISFITDSRPSIAIAKFIEKSDLLICEGTYGDDNDIEKAIINKHMTFREAAKLAREGKVKKLILTHFSTAMVEPDMYLGNAKDEFENTILGSDGLKDTLSFIENHEHI